MNNLYRDLAPVGAEAWKEIEDEARRTLSVTLAARKIVDFTGPVGWETSCIGLGRVERIADGPADGIEARLRKSQPLVELRVPFELPREELDAIGRGAKDPDLEAVQEAARKIAKAEDGAVFHGFAGGGIIGMKEAAAEAAIPIPDDYELYPGIVATAVSHLRQTGVDGPYAIALGPRCYTGLTRTMTRSGHLVMDFVRRIVDGPVVWAPAIDGAAVISMRGGDFELIVGQDISIGYLSHSTDTVSLYMEESFTFRILAAEAVVPLIYTGKGGGKK